MTAGTDQDGFELLKIEYESCWALLRQNVEIIQKTEIYAAGAIAGIFAFVLGKDGTVLRHQILYICPLIAIMGWLRFEGVNGTIKIISAYIESVESRYAEISYNSFRKNFKPQPKLKWGRRAFWLINIAFSLYVAFDMKLPA